MTVNFHILNDIGLQKFEDFITLNRKKFGINFPMNLLSDDKYSQPADIEINFEQMQGMDLWKIGKTISQIIDTSENQDKLRHFNYKNTWASFTLYLNKEIRPIHKVESRDVGIYEHARYLIIKRKEYRHLIFSSYSAYKKFGDNSKYIISKNHTHSTPTDRFLGREASRRYPETFSIVSKFYNDGKKIENLMIMIGIIARNKSLYDITESELMDILPKKLKQQLEL